MVELYRQFCAIVNDPEKQNVLPPILTGSLAESLGRTLAHYDGLEHQFMEDLFCIWSDIERLNGSEAERFRRLYYDSRLERFKEYNPQGDERRRPKPFEASAETSRRLKDVNRVRDALAHVPTGAILGGSVSYGRFYNVCGASTGKASDTDLLLVLASYDNLPELPRTLQGVEGLDKQSLRNLSGRIELFNRLRSTSPHLIISHKLKFWEDTPDPYLSRYQIPGHYLLSLHIFSSENFRYMILKDKPILVPDSGSQFIRELVDYRDTPPTRYDNQRSFSGIDSTIPLIKEEVDGGFLSRVRACHIESDRFFPGLHQNLILPQFEIRWESPSVRLYLDLLSFRWKILERLREERRLRPYEVQSLSLSHTRNAVFAPHITRRADRE